jgi:hypothetical protein
MSRTADVELVLREYLADDGAAAPDYVLDSVSDRIRRQGQARRRAWLSSWRLPQMRSNVRLAAWIAAVLAIALLAFGIIGSGRNAPVATSPGPATPTLANPSASAEVPAPSSSASTTAYSTTTFGIPFSATFLNGWHLVDETTGSVDLYAGNVEVLVFDAASLQQFTPAPGQTGPTINDRTLAPFPDDWQGWLRAQPEFTIAATTPATIGGKPASIVDVDIAPVAFDPRRLFTFDNGHWGVDHAVGRYRFVVIDVGPAKRIVLFLPSSVAGASSAAAALDSLLATVVFG